VIYLKLKFSLFFVIFLQNHFFHQILEKITYFTHLITFLHFLLLFFDIKTTLKKENCIFSNHLAEIKKVESQFDQDSSVHINISVNIKNCQGLLERDGLSAELVFIYCHLSFLPGAITRLEKQDFPCLRSSQLWKKQREKSIAFHGTGMPLQHELFSTRIQVYSVALSLRARVVKVCPLESVPRPCQAQVLPCGTCSC